MVPVEQVIQEIQEPQAVLVELVILVLLLVPVGQEDLVDQDKLVLLEQLVEQV